MDGDVMEEHLPATIMAEFLRPDGSPLLLGELGAEFMELNGVGLDRRLAPFRVAIRQKTSKAGNFFYEYSQNAIPFPTGFDTLVRVEHQIIPLGRLHQSEKGNPTREGNLEIPINGTIYRIVVYLTSSKMPFFVRIVAHKKPNASQSGKKLQAVPKGGSLI